MPPTPPADALLALLRGRRSVRRFLPDPVTEEQIERLVEAARWAPSASNRQAWRLIVVSSPPRIGAMAEAVRSASARLREGARTDTAAELDAYLQHFLHFATAPLVIAPIHRGGLDLLKATAGAADVDGRRELDALSSVAAAIQNLLLCAHAMGLGACWMTGPLVAEEALRPLLEVPAGWSLSALVPVGRPAEEPPPPARRAADQLVRRL